MDHLKQLHLKTSPQITTSICIKTSFINRDSEVVVLSIDRLTFTRYFFGLVDNPNLNATVNLLSSVPLLQPITPNYLFQMAFASEPLSRTIFIVMQLTQTRLLLSRATLTSRTSSLCREVGSSCSVGLRSQTNRSMGCSLIM